MTYKWCATKMNKKIDLVYLEIKLYWYLPGQGHQCGKSQIYHGGLLCPHGLKTFQNKFYLKNKEHIIRA